MHSNMGTSPHWTQGDLLEEACIQLHGILLQAKIYAYPQHCQSLECNVIWIIHAAICIPWIVSLPTSGVKLIFKQFPFVWNTWKCQPRNGQVPSSIYFKGTNNDLRTHIPFTTGTILCLGICSQFLFPNFSKLWLARNSWMPKLSLGSYMPIFRCTHLTCDLSDSLLLLENNGIMTRWQSKLDAW